MTVSDVPNERNCAVSERIPVRLKKEPLIEAVWEIRFASEKKAVADLLPGLIYKAIPDRYPNTVRLPIADIPAPIVEKDPNLHYIPKIKLEGANQAVQIGEHVLSLSCRRPYSGWREFSSDIRSLISVGRDTGLIDHLERFSLKYIDLIELDPQPDLTRLNMEIKLSGIAISKEPVQIRTEIVEGEFIHIIQVLSPAEASLPGDKTKLKGVLLDIDTICVIKPNGSWDEIETRLDAVHESSKRHFFTLLTAETIESLEPEY
jgi:uncharacterized protein (TIGR04255 family)